MLAADVTVWPIVIAFAVAMAAFGGSLPFMIRDSRRAQPRIQHRPAVRAPRRVEREPAAAPPRPEPTPAPHVPAWRVGTVAASFFLLSTWVTWSARSRHSTRH